MEYIFLTKALAPAYPKVPGKKMKQSRVYHLTMIEVCNGRSRHSESGGRVHPDSVIGGGGLKKTFPPFRLQFGLKIRGGVGPRAPSLDPSLVLETFGFEDEDEIRNKVFFAYHGILESLTLQFLFYFTGKVCTVIFIEGG